MGSSVATANPVVFGAGGAPATASQGETVVPVAGSAEVRVWGRRWEWAGQGKEWGVGLAV